MVSIFAQEKGLGFFASFDKFLPTFRAGCFSKSTVPAFSSFSDLLREAGKTCLAAIFDSRHLDVSPGPRVFIGSASTTLDPNTSAKASRYKWEPYCDTIGGVYTTFCQEEGMLLQKYYEINGRCIAMGFNNIRVRGRFDSPDY